MHLFRGVILDVDGTLVDTNDAHARAFVDAFFETGRDVPFERIRPLIGMGSDKLIKAASGIDAGTPLGARVKARKKALFMSRYLPEVQPFPGARKLLLRLRELGLGLVTASAAEADELHGILDAGGLYDLVETATAPAGEMATKPDPDIVEIALARLGLAPGEAVMLGDTPYDMEAATRAGVRFLGFRCGGWPTSAFPGAIAVFTGPEELAGVLRERPLSAISSL